MQKEHEEEGSGALASGESPARPTPLHLGDVSRGGRWLVVAITTSLAGQRHVRLRAVRAPRPSSVAAEVVDVFLGRAAIRRLVHLLAVAQVEAWGRTAAASPDSGSGETPIICSTCGHARAASGSSPVEEGEAG